MAQVFILARGHSGAGERVGTAASHAALAVQSGLGREEVSKEGRMQNRLSVTGRAVVTGSNASHSGPQTGLDILQVI